MIVNVSAARPLPRRPIAKAIAPAAPVRTQRIQAQPVPAPHSGLEKAGCMIGGGLLGGAAGAGALIGAGALMGLPSFFGGALLVGSLLTGAVGLGLGIYLGKKAFDHWVK